MQDLSHLTAGPCGGSSMSAVNDVSDQRASMSAPGSKSEASADVTPGLPGPVMPAQRERTVVHPSGPRDGSPWHPAGDGSPWERS